MQLPAGRYFLEIPEAEGNARGIQNLIADADVSYEVVDADRDAASAGLGMAITGMTLIPAGILLAVLGSGCLFGCQTMSGGERAALWGGAAASVSGVILTPVGWVQWARNKRPKLTRSGWDVGFGGAPGGGLVRLSGSF